MTSVVADIVDVYVFRRLNARVQFLLLQRRNDVPLAQTWQAFHQEISAGDRAPDAARKVARELAGIDIDRFYSADFINQFYDEARDVVVLAPVLAVTLVDQSSVDLSDEFQDAGWFDRDEATARLPFSGQRWAVRHIDEIMSIGETESEIYRFDPDTSAVVNTDVGAPAVSNVEDNDSRDAFDQTNDDGLEPMAEDSAHQVDNAQPDLATGDEHHAQAGRRERE